MDPVATFYSGPNQTGGALVSYRQLGGRWENTWRKYAIPFWKNFKEKLTGVAKGAADALKNALSESLVDFAGAIPKIGLKGAASAAIENFADKVLSKVKGGGQTGSGVKRKWWKKGGKAGAKHKRSHIDDILGGDDGDTY